MKSPIYRSALAAVAFCLLTASFPTFAGATPTPPAAPSAACAGGTALNGLYGLLISGTGSGSRYMTGVVNFNGACSLTGTNFNGGISGAVSNTTATGTYGQNSDGTYNLSITLANQATPLTFTIGVSASGNKAVGIESDGSTSATIDLESQLTTLTNGYSTASLTGTYAVSCSGSGVDLNYVTFDGKGDLSGVDPFDNGGSQGNSPYAGNYAVNSDGSFTGSLTGSYSEYTFSGVIDNGVTEIAYTYDQSGEGETVACFGRQAPAATLSGYYGMLVGGTATNGSGGGRYLSGSVLFNSNGTLTATNLQGGINTQYGNTTATGTWSVNSDSTITITMNLAGQSAAQTYIVGISEGGNEAVGIETDGTAAAVIDLQSQLVSNGSSYSTASLNGTYSVICSGSEVDLNYVTFDGNGNQTGSDAYDNGSYGDNPYVGTYTVNSDGTFSGGFSGAYAGYTVTGVIDNANSEIEYTYDYQGQGGVVYCWGFSAYGPIGTNPVAATPTLSPAPGSYSSTQTVSLTTTTPGATIYYTTNGVTPTTSSLVYGTPIPVSATTTIEAIAVASNYNNSAIGAGTYFFGSSGTPAAATPTFNPLPGSYSSAQTVTLSDTTPGAVIHCTTDGSTPTASSPVCTTLTISSTTTLQAIAVATGYSNSGIASGLYTIGSAGFTVSVSPATFTLAENAGGTVNVTANVLSGFSGTVTFTASGFPSGVDYTFLQTSSTTAILVAFVPTGTPVGNSTVTLTGTSGTLSSSTTFTFTVTSTNTAATPSFSPIPGTYSSAQTVTLSDVTAGAVIHCTTDGSTPTASSPVCTTVSVSANTTIGAIAVATGYNNSAVATGVYTIQSTAVAPTFSPVPGTYSSAQTVTLSDSTPGAVIHCTTNGSTPTPTSPVCTSLTVSSSTTIEAIAVASGYNNSAVATGGYTITSSGTGGTPVNLSGYYNVYAIGTSGTAPKGGGIGNTNYVYDSAALGTALTYQGVNFSLGAANTADAVSNTTVSLPAGSYSQLYLVGAAYYGPITNQSVVVTYKDGTSSTFTQSFSDWGHSGGATYSGETNVISTADRITPSGATQSGPWYVYGYTFNLTPGETVASVKLPASGNVFFFGIGLSTGLPTAATPTFSPAPGTYSSTQAVTLSDSTSGAVIHCTTNGTTPTASSPVCTTVTVSASTTIEALAVASGYSNSAVATGLYTITAKNLIPNGTYTITSVYSGLALDDPAFSKAAGVDIQQYTLNNGTNQQWTVNNLGNNVITLTNVASNLVLEVAGASKANSALVDQNNYSGLTSQQWSVTSVSGGAYELLNVNSGLALDVDGGGKTVGEAIDQYPYKGNAWQQWKFNTP
jgi:hypothetical protein